MNGKGDKPRNISNKFRDNWDNIDWSKSRMIKEINDEIDRRIVSDILTSELLDRNVVEKQLAAGTKIYIAGDNNPKFLTTSAKCVELPAQYDKSSDPTNKEGIGEG